MIRKEGYRQIPSRKYCSIRVKVGEGLEYYYTFHFTEAPSDSQHHFRLWGKRKKEKGIGREVLWSTCTC